MPMSTEKTITVKAADGAMTIADLRAFLDQFDKGTGEGGVYPGFHDGLKPKARVSFGGRIKSITVTVPDGEAAP
jgi:hypothetical protein